ncbi:MAG: hypothetical protein R3Y47_09625 [Lachnospiraceae bacterium]
MLDIEQMETMAGADITSADKNRLVDISTIKVDKELPVKERIKNYIEQIKNPYCFKVNDTVVKIKFSDTDITMEQCLEGYFGSL